MTKEFINVLKFFLQSLSNKECSDEYADLFKGLIGKTKDELKSDSDIDCFKAGKSQQKVYVCSDYVYKAQPLNVSRRIDPSEYKNDIKVDSFTMNVIMQNMMKSIVENFDVDAENVEHPLDLCTNNNHLLMIYEKTNFGDFQKFLTDTGLDYFEDDYLNEIINILTKVFEVNDKLYEICQFQHCDMKCMQILLNKDNNGKISPILSDFDKSTCSLFFNGQAYRIRLVKLDTPMMGDVHNNSGIEFIRGSKKYRKTRRKRKTRKTRKTRKSRKLKKTRKNKRTRKGGSLKKYLKRSAKKLGAKIFHKTPKGIKRMAYGDQGLQRFKNMPLKDNRYYNACLLASTLLQAEIEPRFILNVLKQNRRYSYLIDCIDLDFILNARNRSKGGVMGNLREMNDTNLSGNVIAAQSVKYPKMFEKSNSLQSDVEVVIKGSEITFVKKNKTFSSRLPSKTNFNTRINNYIANKSIDPKDYGYVLMNTNDSNLF